METTSSIPVRTAWSTRARYSIRQRQTTVNGQMCRYPFATDNVIPANRIDSVAKNVLKYFQKPNQNTSLGINGDYYYVVPTPYPSTRIFGRIDYDFNDKNRLTSSIAVRNATSPVYSEWTCPVACYHDDTSDYSSQTSDVWSFSSTFVNEARFSFNRQGSFLTPYSLGAGIPATIGLQYAKADVFPNLNIIGERLLRFALCRHEYNLRAERLSAVGRSHPDSRETCSALRRRADHAGGQFHVLGQCRRRRFQLLGAVYAGKSGRRPAAAPAGPTSCWAMCRAGERPTRLSSAVARKIRSSLSRMTSSFVRISP